MSSSEEPVLSSSVTLEGRSLWFGTLKLYEEELVVSGWTWTGPVEERIAIDDIALVEKWTVTLGPNFRVHITDDRDPLFGRIQKGAKFWELTLEKHERIDFRLRH